MREEDFSTNTSDLSEHPAARSTEPIYVKVEDVRPEGYDGTCLRPLGLCELGGCCDACWYRPDHPRFQRD
jgi:hypothetical protein